MQFYQTANEIYSIKNFILNLSPENSRRKRSIIRLRFRQYFLFLRLGGKIGVINVFHYIDNTRIRKKPKSLS